MEVRTATPRLGWRVVLAACAMATGAALVAFIVLGLPSLAFALMIFVPVSLAIVSAVVVRLPAPTRAALAARARAGVVAALAALAAYDGLRWITAHTVVANIDPFAAWPVFGEAIVGEGSPRALAVVVGVAYHLLNGIAFAVSYAILVPRGGVLSGVAWGLALEGAMLAVYPGWLDIRAIREFTTVSILGHVAYGATLGALVPRLLARSGRRARDRLADAP